MEKKTPLYERHLSSNGKMVPYAGYLMPVQYELGVIKEHMAVRTAVGLFDVSHMGEIALIGKDAINNIQRLVTNDCSNMYDGQIKYSPMCNEEGGVIDDLLIYRKSEYDYLLVVNAANRMKDAEWISKHLEGEVEFEDISDQIAQLALQGPKAQEVLEQLTDPTDIPVKYYTFKENIKVAGISCMISRTGYTGEDGFELYCKSEDVTSLWDALLQLDNDNIPKPIPCGLGSRDTLRLEASMPLYGHEMDEDISPLETGLGFAVKMNKEDFIGKEGIIAKGTARKRVGLKLLERGIAREGCPVLYNGIRIGNTTSGTHCPYLGKPLAMALLEEKYCDIGTPVDVEIRGKVVKAEVISLPFYKRK